MCVEEVGYDLKCNMGGIFDLWEWLFYLFDILVFLWFLFDWFFVDFYLDFGCVGGVLVGIVMLCDIDFFNEDEYGLMLDKVMILWE